MVFATVNVA